GGVGRRRLVGRLGRGLGREAGRCLIGLPGLRDDGLRGGGALLLHLGLLEQLLLPLGQRLGIDGRDVLLAAGGLGVTLLQAGGHGVGDHPGQQRDGAVRVVVVRARVWYHVGIAGCVRVLVVGAILW